MASASSLPGLNRQSRLFSGSAWIAPGPNLELILAGAGTRDEAVRFLDRPAGFDEPQGQPVEQGRVDRERAELAEVVGGRGDPFAETPAPDPVEHHPAGGRVVQPGEPTGQFQPAAPVSLDGRRVGRGQDDGHPAGDFLADARVAAPDVNVGVGDLPFGHAHRGGHGRGGLLQRGPGVAQPLQFGLGLVGEEGFGVFLGSTKSEPGRGLEFLWSSA